MYAACWFELAKKYVPRFEEILMCVEFKFFHRGGSLLIVYGFLFG